MLKTQLSLRDYGYLKIELLAQGINYDDEFLQAYSQRDNLLEKRRAYGNSDEIIFSKETKVPQEIILPENIVVAVNYRSDSKWKLTFNNNNFFITNSDVSIPIKFPRRPTFYNSKMSNGTNVSRYVTLYGNATAAMFSPGTCYLWSKKAECKFCSLQPTRDEQADHEMYIKPEDAKEAIKIVLEEDGDRIEHILLNGGTISNYDLGFNKHIDILEAISELEISPLIQKHLISMPPKDFKLFERLAKTGANIAMDLEIYDPKLFEEICPGKASDYGRDRFMEAYKSAVDYLGRGNVYAGFVAGLEPAESLIEGMYELGELGVVPAINIFHSDPKSQLANHPRPSQEYIEKIGHHMSIVYKKYNFVPFLKNTGRNSLDTEAYLQCYA
ncbi:radical SAM protein [Aeribacillus sp. FSL M8-0254]|uniref:radical SAM protein n=1 Tax=Aeribacillus sp. FSL M8-0254 TaxID=2954577 RepID=UPI0030F60D2D